MKIVYISDFFHDEVLGGCELNDRELINVLEERSIEVKKIKSIDINEKIIEENQFFIISNFCLIDQKLIKFFYNKKYILYEHDHKYIKNRNPGLCKNFTCSEDKIANYDFYKNASSIFCQSSFHKNIIYNNLKIDNITNLSGNLWSLKDLEFVREKIKNPKKDACSILLSAIEHKNTLGAISFCKNKNLNYELIESQDYYEFLNKLGKNNYFCFIPKTPETLSRVVIEAKMMNITVFTNKLVGALYEDWFYLNGEELINFMINKRQEVCDKILVIL